MTNQEALKRLRHIQITAVLTDVNKDIEAIALGKKALENQKIGHWKKISPAGIMECSVCGGNVLTSDIEAYKYCHHCGAEMKGESDETCNKC